MDIDFPLVITLATLVTGLVWLGDVLLLKPRRLAAAGGQAAAAAAEGAGAGAAGEGAADLGLVDSGEPVLVEYCRAFFPVLAVVLILRSFIFEPYTIPSESMVPTLEVGDFIIVNKWAYGLRLPVLRTKILDVSEPQRGEVMVFIPPHKDQYFIKRVVGLPGDHITYLNKQLVINGEAVATEFVRQFPAARPDTREFRETLGGIDHLIQHKPWEHKAETEWTVPAGHYFMMGDNRDRSADSRSWGFVPEENIVGKAVGIWMHWQGWTLPSFQRNGAIE